MRARFRIGFVVVLASISALAMTGCSNNTADNGRPQVVATTNVWGAIAAAVAGDDATVTSLITDPSADPHSFELGAAQAAELSDADLIVYNGGGYDPYVDQVLESSPDVARVNAFDVRTDKSDTNEHVWFDYGTVVSVVQGIANALADKDPAHASGYQERAKEFEGSLKSIQDDVQKIAIAHVHAPITETEPVPHYLVTAANLDDVTPPEFQKAIEDGNDPSPASTAAFRDLLESKRAKVLIYNIQAQDSSTQALRDIASKAGVQVVEITETLPKGMSYLDWQRDTVARLAAALS
ncbi:MAG: zinc ABC transporter substrate-binding protein [Nocardiaceae bacterium]|nr:zinc ABC transporter substrate-binding protein [Nocardiaceae bacterium]